MLIILKNIDEINHYTQHTHFADWYCQRRFEETNNKKSEMVKTYLHWHRIMTNTVNITNTDNYKYCSD